MSTRLGNIVQLGIKQLRGLARDPIMLALIFYSFTVAVYSASTSTLDTLNYAPIAIVDEDRSPLSSRIASAFYPPYFKPPELSSQQEMDSRMDARPRHLHARHPTELPARPAGGKVAFHPAQHRCDPNGAGVFRGPDTSNRSSPAKSMPSAVASLRPPMPRPNWSCVPGTTRNSRPARWTPFRT